MLKPVLLPLLLLIGGCRSATERPDDLDAYLPRLCLTSARGGIGVNTPDYEPPPTPEDSAERAACLSCDGGLLPQLLFPVESLAARRMWGVPAGENGTAVIAFTITREGGVLDPIVEESGGHACDVAAAVLLCGLTYSPPMNEFGRPFSLDYWRERVPCSP